MTLVGAGDSLTTLDRPTTGNTKRFLATCATLFSSLELRQRPHFLITTYKSIRSKTFEKMYIRDHHRSNITKIFLCSVYNVKCILLSQLRSFGENAFKLDYFKRNEKNVTHGDNL